MKTNPNDQKILALKDQIAVKKAALAKIAKFSPVTNCILELDGVRYNINVISGEQLFMLRLKLNMFKTSAFELGILDDQTICGFKIEDWVADVDSRSQHLTRKTKEAALKSMETKLDNLLSGDVRTELELNAIDALLND